MKRNWVFWFVVVVVLHFGFYPSVSHAFFNLFGQPVKVEVNNTPSNPVPVVVQNNLEPTKTPINLSLGEFVFESETSNSRYYISSHPYDLPDGYLLVIEQIFVCVSVPSDAEGVFGSLLIYEAHEGGSSSSLIPFELVDQGLGQQGRKNLISSQPTKLYIYKMEENETNRGITATIIVRGGADPNLWSLSKVTLSGYLEEIQ